MKVIMCCVWEGCKRKAPLKGPWYCKLHLRMKKLLDQQRAERIKTRLHQ